MARARARFSACLLFGLFAVQAHAAETAPIPGKGGCFEALRAVIARIPTPETKLRDAAMGLLNGKGRAQELEVQRILDEHTAEAARLAPGADAEQAWSETVLKWQDDVMERMRAGGNQYPKPEELLALMAAKSPTFKSGMLEFLHDHGSLRFKIVDVFDSKVGKSKMFGKFGPVKLKLPSPKPWTDDEFAQFMTEISDTVFRASHPEPGFVKTWLKAFGPPAVDADAAGGQMIWRKFADRVQLDYRARYKAFMEGVSREAFGTPRPEVVAEFYKWGIRDAVYRRLAALKVLVSKEGGNIIERHTGLTLEEIDLINKSPLYDALPRAAKNALIVSKNPGLTAALLLDQEVERLSLEIMWFVQPVVEAAFLYWTVEPAYGVLKANRDRKRVAADIKAHPDKYLPQHPKADDDRLKNYDDQIARGLAEKKQLQKELAQQPPLSAAEQEQRRQAIAKIDRKVANLTDLKATLKKGIVVEETK